MGRRGFAGQSVRFETLEPRTMFSADVVALVAPEPLVEQAVVTGALAEPAPVRIDMQGAAPATARSEAAAQRRELVVVDASIADYLALVDDVLGNDAADVARQILVLDSTRDGLTQITAALTASRAPYDALHLIGHANATGMQLGAVWLTAGDIARHADELADWRSALSDDADILLYGCDLAQAAQGQRLVQALAAATGADIAASTDLTGQPVLGGDWVLEYRVGSIQSDLAIGAPL